MEMERCQVCNKTNTLCACGGCYNSLSSRAARLEIAARELYNAFPRDISVDEQQFNIPGYLVYNLENMLKEFKDV